MVRYLTVILIVLLSFQSCKTTKDVQRQDEDRQLTETSKKITTRLGDTVRYVVPNVIFKDTVITIKNKQTGTTQILRYNDEGKLSSAECLSGVIQIIEENNRILIENINNLNKHKEVEIPTSIILYFFLGLTLLIGVVMTVFFFLMKKYIKTLIPVV